MVHTDCSYCLMKAISCYVHKDERVWVYLYETAQAFCEQHNRPKFLQDYECDLHNALWGFDHVLEPYDWIAQMLLWCNVGVGRRLFGTAIYGKTTDINIRYRLD